MEQQKYASLTTLREQYIKQYRQTIVSLKGICQAWGLNISKGISGKARLKDLIENHAAFPEELKESLVDMVTHAQTAQKALNKITKTLELLAKNDKVCQLIQTIPGWDQSAAADFVQLLGISEGSKSQRFSCLLWLGAKKHCYGAQREERKNHPSWGQNNEIFNGARGRERD